MSERLKPASVNYRAMYFIEKPEEGLKTKTGGRKRKNLFR